MPVYNCAATLGAALRSILNQTFSNWELILVDDGSTDETLHVARAHADPRIRVFADGLHLGLVERLNQAIDVSEGKYFARMDGDDVCYPERFERQVRYLEEHSDVDLLGCRVLAFKGNGLVLGTRRVPLSHGDICERPWAGFNLAHPTWVGRMQWFRRHHYRSDAVRCEDQDLLRRTYKASRFANLPNILVGYREESVSLRKNFASRYSICKSLLREAFEHRNYLAAARGVISQNLKALVDVFAVTTGLNYRVLRHRAIPVEESVKRRWAQVWGKVQEEDPMFRSSEVVASRECL
jgi:glycosyltransferase involved in cell wall biosynthesis